MKMTLLAMTGALLLVAACGKNESLSKQEAQRSDLGPELQGRWESNCEGKQIHRLDVQGKKMTFERLVFWDAECQEKERTLRHSGDFDLAHTFKEGVLNSIIFVAENDVKLTLHKDYLVEAQNNALAKIGDEKETPSTEKMTVTQKKETQRENLRIRSVKALTVWKQDEEKALNRLHLEKLANHGLNDRPPFEQSSRTGIRYEVDNGHLQLTGASDFSRAYLKK